MKPNANRSDVVIAAIAFFILLLTTGNFLASIVLVGLILLIYKTFNGSFSFDTYSSRNDHRLDYTNEILALVSVILTKDKKILKSELNYVKRFLNQNFSEEEAKQYLIRFRDYTKKNLSIEKICKKLDYELDHSGKRQILHLIIGAAVADRELTEAELVDIYRIGHFLSIRRITVDSLLSMHSFHYTGRQSGGYQQQSNQQQYRRRTSSGTSLNHAYKILEITPQATEAEIKKAYRKLAVIYHPDKVMNMGESHQKSAKEKFQKIQAAYEQIKSARGIK